VSEPPALPLGRRHATAQGTVAWDSWGTGPPLVLVHGTPWSAQTWRNVAPALAADRTVYAYDLPGYGTSEQRDGQDLSLAAQGRVLCELLDTWRLEAPTIVGHDIGGGIVLRAALVHERAFAAIALLNPVALAPWGSPFYRLVREHEDVFDALPAPIHAGLVDAYIRTALALPVARDVLDALVSPWLSPAGQAALYRQIAHGDERDTDEFRDRLGTLTPAPLVIWGEQDAWIPVERGHELATLIPGAELRTIARAGHLVQEDAPGAVLGHLLPFLTRELED
jgi:pimeloyl-ACP methyl ester carboxylesterase